MTELKLQQECYMWFNRTFPDLRKPYRLFRIKNELDNHPRKTVEDKMKQLSENKATGVNKGIADFVFIDKQGGSHWIELKVEDGKQSPEQKDFEAIVKNYYICYTLNEFQQIMKKITLILMLAITAVSCTKEAATPTQERQQEANFTVTDAYWFYFSPSGQNEYIKYTYTCKDTAAIKQVTFRLVDAPGTAAYTYYPENLKNGTNAVTTFAKPCNCYDYSYSVTYKDGSRFISEPKRPR